MEDRVERVNGIQEDRISTLPDELLHHILSYVDSNVAVQTCVLSKRWVNLWSTLPFLKFEPDFFDRNRVCYRKFVTDLISNRNQHSDTCSIEIDFEGFDESTTRMIVEYAISHKVEKFLISSANIDYALNFTTLRNLSLRYCEVNLVNWSLPSLETLYYLSHCELPLLTWSLPSLTTLHLENVSICNGERLLNFEGFNRLKKLTLIDCGRFSGMEVVMINLPNLTSLTIYHNYTDGPLPCKFMVSAPNLSYFGFEGRCVPAVSAVDGFPLLNHVNLDIRIGKYEWKEYNSEEKKNELVQKLVSLFHELQRTKFLTLSFMTIQVLSRLPRISEYQPSPFDNLKSLYMVASGWMRERLIDLPDHVIIYLQSSSPCAKIFVEFPWGELENYNPEENLLLWDHYGTPVIKYKAAAPSSTKIDASTEVPKPEETRNKTISPPQNQQATTDVLGNGSGMPNVLGVIPPAVIRGALNDKTCAYKEKNSFSLWEGHQIYSEYVNLLTHIKEKHPETFEQFAPQTDIICTMGLNTLGRLVQAFSEDCRSKFTAAKITRYRGLFSDMDKLGFNTTWLVNELRSSDNLVSYVNHLTIDAYSDNDKHRHLVLTILEYFKKKIQVMRRCQIYPIKFWTSCEQTCCRRKWVLILISGVFGMRNLLCYIII